MSPLTDVRARYRRWLFDQALPLWWKQGADQANGGFHEALTLEGEPVTANRRARVQARQIYVNAARARWLGRRGGDARA